MLNVFNKQLAKYTIPENKITLNAEKSNIFNKKLMEKGIVLHKRQCYENVFRSINHTTDDVLYAFMEMQNIELTNADSTLYFRHCLFVNEENEAVCPTLPLIHLLPSTYETLDIIPIARIKNEDYMKSFTDAASNGDGTYCYSKLFAHEKMIEKKMLMEMKFALG